MADRSSIEWTDATWNAIVGCSILTPGCTHCYAMGMAARIEAMTAALQAKGQTGAPHYIGTTRKVNGKSIWTGKLAMAPDHILLEPLTWRAPRRIFVNSMGDLFHEDVPDEWIDKVFAIMALAPQHTFQVLTKRAKRMREYVRNLPNRDDLVADQAVEMSRGDHRRHVMFAVRNPLPNVWLGVSAERQQEADARIPQLLATPAAVRFVSAEPLLGPIDFTKVQRFDEAPKEFVHALAGRFWTDQTGLPKPDPSWAYPGRPFSDGGRGLDWIIVGGESGPDARPMHPDWARDIRDDCKNASVSFFFKQWGEWAPGECAPRMQLRTERGATWFNEQWIFESITPAVGQSLHRDDAPDVYRFGKRDLTRTLDGIEHNAMPEVAA